MSQNTNLQERYSSIVEAKLRAESVFAKLFNNKHDGTPLAGAVKIPVRSDAQVGAYDIAQGGSLANPATSYVPMVCDKDLYVNELIDGFVAAAVPDNMVAERLDSAGYSLADALDTRLAALCEDTTETTGTATAFGNTTALTSSTAYGKIVDAIQTAVKAKVAKRNIWVVVSPDVYGLLMQSSEFVNATANVEELGGEFRKIDGCPVMESANLASTTEFIVGNRDFCHYVADWIAPVAVKDIADGKHIGASAVQGRQVCGYTVSKPATVLVKKHA